jgi:hypothetical protein
MVGRHSSGQLLQASDRSFEAAAFEQQAALPARLSSRKVPQSVGPFQDSRRMDRALTVGSAVGHLTPQKGYLRVYGETPFSQWCIRH